MPKFLLIEYTCGWRSALPVHSISSSPSFVPVWALAGTLWDRCKCSSSYSQQLALSAPRSRSSHSGCPKMTGSWTTYHLRGGERKGWRNKDKVMGPLIRWWFFKEKSAMGQVMIRSSWLPYSCFLLGSFKWQQYPHTTAWMTLFKYSKQFETLY